MFCDFCKCGDCQNGREDLSHAQTEDGRWICDVCWRYEVCIDAKYLELKKKNPELKKCRGVYPCEDKDRKPIADCGHRPKLVTDWIPFSEWILRTK